MIKIIRRRFILFNMLVIGVIVVLVGLYIFMGSPNTRPLHNYLLTFLGAMVLVFIGSLLLSKIAIRPIQAAWQKQLDFTADASHELRTPITVMQTNLELVLESPKMTVESQLKWLKNIEAENQRMARLVEDLLTLSRADAGGQTLQKEDFMVSETLTEALAPFLPIAAAKNIVLKATAREQTAFFGDRKRFVQLIIILVDNALHYTDTGEVEVSITENEKELTLTVADTGRGIAPEHLDKIFERFYRVTDTRAMHNDGAGLGLSIAKWIAQQHGGRIYVESSPNSGTVFAVNLPVNTH
jgi:signal transduction histidine kinase